MEKKFKYTVFEHIDRGTRFFTDYCPDDNTKGLKIVDHTETIEQAQKLWTEKENLNYFHFFNDIHKTFSDFTG